MKRKSRVAAALLTLACILTLLPGCRRGYVLDRWEVVTGDVTPETGSDGTASFTMPNEAVSLVAHYRWASLVLNYGNSPAGHILDGSGTEEEKAAALEAFRAEHVLDGRQFSPNAWAEQNLDEDPEALFAYDLSSLTDPGVTAWYQDGTNVPADAVTVTLKGLTTYPGGPGALGTAVLLEDWPLDRIRELEDKRLTPGIYAMEYRFTDRDGETVHTALRPVVLLAPLGDASLDGHVNSVDANFIRSFRAKPQGVGESLWRLYLYRVCDARRAVFLIFF